jgi:hypothetical protein
LSEEFYQAFTDFEFMLIYQLDAFVFRDELADWCRSGYEYIGAPWLRDRDFTSWKDETVFNIKKKIAILLDLKKGRWRHSARNHGTERCRQWRLFASKISSSVALDTVFQEEDRQLRDKFTRTSTTKTCSGASK